MSSLRIWPWCNTCWVNTVTFAILGQNLRMMVFLLSPEYSTSDRVPWWFFWGSIAKVVDESSLFTSIIGQSLGSLQHRVFILFLGVVLKWGCCHFQGQMFLEGTIFRATSQADPWSMSDSCEPIFEFWASFKRCSLNSSTETVYIHSNSGLCTHPERITDDEGT